MKLYLIRHGKMAGDPFISPKSPVTGCLSEEGISQAESLKKALKSIKFDMAFSSPIGRALQTAEIALKGRDIPITTLPFLHEWMPNRALEEIPLVESEKIHEKFQNIYPEESWETELGEGCFDMYARICPPFLKVLDSIGIHSRYGGYIIDKVAKDLSIVVFAHGGTLNVLLSFLLELRPTPISRFSFNLTGVAEVNFKKYKEVCYPELIIPTLFSSCLSKKEN